MNPIAWTAIADGHMRPVFEDMDGRQYVIDNDGETIYGVWYIPRDQFDEPFVVGDDQPAPNF